MIWGTDDLVRTSLFPGSWPLEWNTIFIIAVRINLWRLAIEKVSTSNWKHLQRGRDGGIWSDQISSILLAVCKQLLINNIVTVWRQMTPRHQKNTHSHITALGQEKLPAGVLMNTHTHSITHAYGCTEWRTHSLTHTHAQADFNPLMPFHQRFLSTSFELRGR